MISLRTMIRNGFDRAERLLDRAFGPDWNPLAQLGPIGWLLFWIVAISGIYLFIFFDTGVTQAFASIEWMTNDLWWHAGLARSLHRYASDLMVLVMFVHLLREWSMDRYRGKRWFSWVTGVAVIWFVYLSGITGYWLVWDRLAQYVAMVTTELLDTLGIFAEPITRFVAADAVQPILHPDRVPAHRHSAASAPADVDPYPAYHRGAHQTAPRAGRHHARRARGGLARTSGRLAGSSRPGQHSAGGRHRLVPAVALSGDQGLSAQ